MKDGDGILRAAVGGTAVFVCGAAAAAAAGGGPLGVLGAAIAAVLFVAGCLAYLAGYAGAVQRSRREEIPMAALVFLAGCAPRPVQRLLIGATVLQTVVALGAAALRPFTIVAFVILAPMYGLGLQTLWSARHGQFPERPAR